MLIRHTVWAIHSYTCLRLTIYYSLSVNVSETLFLVLSFMAIPHREREKLMVEFCKEDNFQQQRITFSVISLIADCSICVVVYLGAQRIHEVIVCVRGASYNPCEEIVSLFRSFLGENYHFFYYSLTLFL